MIHLFDGLQQMSFVLGDTINLDNISSQGDSNVLGTIQKLYIWIVLAIILAVFVKKAYRAMITVIVIAAVVAVFVYSPDSTIPSLGKSLLHFLGVMN
ncbi:TcpD family membrane protein [Bacillus amyloliquefaciens]|uniref:TcpD family membrane protein n=1 Tax=Bacillus amyloliquefaciens TaxID=1390 RepID=UPI002807410F|nr:TcpD family membrane protein [Bacillus amyloliquefaciens]MDQ8094894.1 TcpD family membrane protein [Bacillus amyloliquefaciens]